MIEYVPQTGSTNADLVARLNSGESLAEGTWLVAERQTAGRGRQGRTWFDGHGNFMGSTVINLTRSCPAPQSLALVASLALYEAVLPSLPNPNTLKVKWPNDLILQGAKLSGILMERVRDTIVMGIGVNLAQAPDLPNRDTIAIADLTTPPSLKVFTDGLAENLAQELQRWRDYGLEPMLQRWTAAAHPKGTQLAVHDGTGEVHQGTFAGLAQDGAMHLYLADGSTRVIHAGDVTLSDKGSSDAVGS